MDSSSQSQGLLIFDQDTIPIRCLGNLPNIELIEKYQFEHHKDVIMWDGDEMCFPYVIATWIIRDNKLFLSHLLDFTDRSFELPILELYKNYIQVDEKIFASWFTGEIEFESGDIILVPEVIDYTDDGDEIIILTDRKTTITRILVSNGNILNITQGKIIE